MRLPAIYFPKENGAARLDRGKEEFMKRRVLLLLLSFCFTVGALLPGCTKDAPTPSAGPSSDYWKRNQQTVSQGDYLENYLYNMNLDGAINEILSAHNEAYVLKLMEERSVIFTGFDDQEYWADDFVKAMWYGEFPGKILTGLAQLYLTNRDEGTLGIGNQFVDRLTNAQEEAGYLGPWGEDVRLNKDTLDPEVGEKKVGKWDTWGQYHCIYGLLRWYQVTGNQKAMDTAKKALDFLYDYFVTGEQLILSQKWGECNFALGYMYALFYEYTGEERYLKAAEDVVQKEWKMEYWDYYTKKILAADWMTAALNGTAYGASAQPRWEGLYSLATLASLYRTTGKKEYYDALDSLYWGIVEYDRHNIGSFGTGEAANCDPYGIHSETCSTVAWMNLSVEYLKCSGNSLVADELELSYYNATLGSLTGNHVDFTYINWSNGVKESMVEMLNHGLDSIMTCCQASGTRGLSVLAEWAVLTGKNGVYLNYYGASNLETYTASGNSLSLKQETEYPKYGNVTITVTPEQAENFTLNVRIPAWSANSSVKVNGETVEGVKAGSYCAISREWKAGDVVEVSLDMSLHYWVADRSAIGTKASVYYGPVLLAFEYSDTLRKTTKFRYADLEKGTIVDAEDCLVALSVVNSKGDSVRLMDYGSVGKNGQEFCSWLSVFADKESGVFQKDALIWNTR